jgi:hypothetical protein
MKDCGIGGTFDNDGDDDEHDLKVGATFFR